MKSINCLNNYDIYLSKSFDGLKEYFNTNINRILVLTDDNVSTNILPDLKNELSDYDFLTYSISDDEKKNVELLNTSIKNFILSVDYDSQKDIIVVFGGGSVYNIFENLDISNAGYIFIPTSLYSMIEKSYILNKIPLFVFINISLLSYLPDRDYFSGFSYVMKNAIIKDAIFYSWLIEMMYEICERDYDTLYDMVEKSLNISKLIIDKSPSNNYEESILLFGQKIANLINRYNKEDYKEGECLSLAIVATAYISWKKNWLTKDEYYEIRDMFVPFYLPISIEMFKINDAIELFINIYSKQDEYQFILLKKIGKTVNDSTVTIEEITAALDELNFDEAW